MNSIRKAESKNLIQRLVKCTLQSNNSNHYRNIQFVCNCAPIFFLDSTGNTVFGLCCLYHLHEQRAQTSSAPVSHTLRSSFFLDFSPNQNRKQSHDRTQDGEASLGLGFASQQLETTGGVTTSTQLAHRILVVTGQKANKRVTETELWPKPESQCALPNCPLEAFTAVGFWTAQGPTVCGGVGGGNRCFIYKEHQWMPWTNMRMERSGASALPISPNLALIIGGYDQNGNTTELISSSGSEMGNEFPVTINRHCSFPINSTHAMVTGGWQDGSPSASTWFVDLTTASVTPGPSMKTRRWGHGCSIFQHGTKSFGIVAGGYKRGRLDSVEMIHLDQESPTWTEGIQDKSKIVYL